VDIRTPEQTKKPPDRIADSEFRSLSLISTIGPGA
jgi:hypothetical protein